MYKHLSTIGIMLFCLIGTATAQVRNPFEMATNNEDEVVHLDQWQRHTAKPLQAIVKLQDYSEYTIVAPKGAKGGQNTLNNRSNQSIQTRVECPAIQAVLDSFLVESVEQLCPTFVMPKEPRRSPSYGGGEVRDHDLSQLYLITLSAESPKHEYELIEALKALEEVEYAEPNYLAYALGGESDSPASRNLVNLVNYSACGGEADATAYRQTSRTGLTSPTGPTKTTAAPNDPMYSLQWGLGACGIDSLLTAPKRDTAWRPIIAIIDTGVDIDHADLADNIWTNNAEQNGATGQDDDGNGFADDVHGWDFVNQTANIHDFNSHGTHCAGIAGAVTNNGIGIAGACPDALIMPVCVMQSDGTGNIATIIQGINYARQNGADVISMSIGTYAYSIAMEQALAVAYQSAVLVAAAGNDHRHIQPVICNHPMCGPMFPGAFTFVLGVQATGTTPDMEEGNSMLASFSNIDNDGGPTSSSYSEEQLYNYELSAPGVGIMSTVPNGQYRNYNGTSMACPLVAGGIASLLQRRDYATKEILWGDLINHSQAFYPIDFWDVYNADSIAPAVLQCVTIEVNDTAYGDSSMYADAGERLQLYPTIRTVWGPADNIEVWLEFQEFEDTNTVHILQNHVAFARPLSSYAHGKSVNPIDIRIDSTVADGRNIKLLLCAYSTDALDTLKHAFTIKVTNGVKLHGMILGNYTLYPNMHYIVTENFAIPNGDTLFIMPGTTIKIADQRSINARIMAIGKPDSMITFTNTGSGRWKSLIANNGSFDYCILEYSYDGGPEISGANNVHNCIIRYGQYEGHAWDGVNCNNFSFSNIFGNSLYQGYSDPVFSYNNVVNNTTGGYQNAVATWNSNPSGLHGCNIFRNCFDFIQ